MKDTDLQYHLKREAAERALAENAANDQARLAHRYMADRYAALVAQSSYDPKMAAGRRSI